MKLFFISILLFLSSCAKSQRDVLGTYAKLGKKYKIVCVANSLTRGANYPVGSDSSYPKKLKLLMPNSNVVNKGVDADTYDGAFAIFFSQIAPLYTPDTISVLVNWEIGNTLWVGYSTDSCIAKVQRYSEYGQAIGFKVLVGTAPYRGFSGNNPAGNDQAYYNRQLDTVNNWVRDNYTSFADGVINFDLDPLINDYNNGSIRDPDKIHYLGPGNQRIAVVVKTEIIKL